MKIVGIIFYLFSLYYLLWFFISGQAGSAIGFINLLCTGALFFYLGNSEMPVKKWFSSKKFGYGWGLPTVWQGWVVYVLFITAMLFVSAVVSLNTHSISDTLTGLIPTVGLLVATLVAICFKYGEKPRWMGR